MEATTLSLDVLERALGRGAPAVADALVGIIDRVYAANGMMREALAARKPYLINANIGADKNPGGAGVWELPGLGQSQPAFGGRYQPQ